MAYREALRARGEFADLGDCQDEHGVLFRDQEEVIRKGVIESDLIGSVIGLGPNLCIIAPWIPAL